MSRKFMSQLLLCVSLLAFSQAWAQRKAELKGNIVDEKNEALAGASVFLYGPVKRQVISDDGGNYSFRNLPYGRYTIEVKFLGQHLPKKTVEVNAAKILFNLKAGTKANDLDKVEVFGVRGKQPYGLDAVTRLPLKPSDQIQSISVISDKLIEQQGSLSVIEAVRNVPGVYTYATYGGVKESIASRGFRGIPTLKNGVRVMTDFRGMGYPTDMEGVESIQVLKGSSAVTQGLGQASGQATDLGAPGGLVNTVTKVPHFYNGGSASIRVGSFGLVRPTFDVQGFLGESGKVAYRLNGAYQNGGKYRKGMSKESFYINPSLAFRPDDKTSIFLEMDYYNVNESVDAGTVNTAVVKNPSFDASMPVSSKNPKYIQNLTNQIYDLPRDRMLGFKTDMSTPIIKNYSARFQRYLDRDNRLYVRGAVMYADFNNDAIKTSLTALGSKDGQNDSVVNIFARSIGHNTARRDRNTVMQFDLVGNQMKTGSVRHVFMVGMDYKYTNLEEYAYNAIVVDTINVFNAAGISNTLPSGTPNFGNPTTTVSKTTNIGFTAQDVIYLTDRLRVFGAIRYSTNQSNAPLSAAVTRTHFWNPLGGIMYAVNPHINAFLSYTNSTRPENVSQTDSAGHTFGNGTVNQFETGIKSDWFNNRLRFNLTLYRIEQKNLVEQLYDINNAPVVYNGHNVYRASGDDRRQGIETEISGRILENLEAIVGYSYIDARYKNTSVYVDGSSPNNTPKHTFNGWLNYMLRRGTLRGLDFGVGYYYLGKRPYNDWTQAGYTIHGLDTSKEPWYNKAYSMTNLQVGYAVNAQWAIRVFANNIFNKKGYDAYRAIFIDMVQPRNVSAAVTYRF